MSPARLALGAVVVVAALLLQLTVVARLPLPGAAPDLLLVVVVAFALAEGPVGGSLTGFAAGLLVDVSGDASLGRTALVFVLVGYVGGLFAEDADRSTVLPVLVVGGTAAMAVVVFAAEGVLLGDPRVTAAAVGRSLLSTVPYTAVLAPLVVPLVAGPVRRLQPEAVHR